MGPAVLGASAVFPIGVFRHPVRAMHTQTVAIVAVVSTPESFFIEIAIAIIVPPNVCSDQMVANWEVSSFRLLPDGYGHLSATFNGQDGDVYMETGSVDRSGFYVFEVTPTQQVESASRTLCFWSIEGDNDSMITVWNYKLTAQDLVLTLYYSGGQYRIHFHLEARQAYNLDMLSLVRRRVADPDGSLIPDNIAGGSAVL